MNMDNFYYGKRVLVTGAAGLVGHSLVKNLLQCGAFVRATTFRNRTLSVCHPNLSIIRSDLMLFEDCMNACKDIDFVFNGVAFVRGAKCASTSQIDQVRNNVIPSINIIDAAARSGVLRFGFIGSSTMYPDVLYPVKENEAFNGDPPLCYTGAGWSKRYCEKMCTHYHSVTNTKFSIVRTTAIYGPHDNFNAEQGHVIPSLIIKIAERRDPLEIWGNGKQIRDFIYVDDLVNAMMLSLEKNCVCDPVNVATGKPTDIDEVVRVLTDIEGYKPQITYNNNMPTMISRRLVDIQKSQNILRWKPRVSIEEGLKRTIKWYKENCCG